MSLLQLLSRYACCILLLCSASSVSTAQENSHGDRDAFARDYQTRGQAVMEAAVPRVISALSADAIADRLHAAEGSDAVLRVASDLPASMHASL